MHIDHAMSVDEARRHRLAALAVLLLEQICRNTSAAHADSLNKALWVDHGQNYATLHDVEEALATLERQKLVVTTKDPDATLAPTTTFYKPTERGSLQLAVWVPFQKWHEVGLVRRLGAGSLRV